MSFKDHDLEHNKNDLLHDTYRYSIMVVDDSSMARKLIKNQAKEINAHIICEASNAEEAYSNYIEFEPDVVTMDISMPGQSGLDAVKKIIKYDPYAKILMVTSHGEESTVLDALESGARGFILKPVTKEKLEEQFNKVKHDPFKMFRSVHYFKDLSERNLKKLKTFTTRSEYLIFLAESSQKFIPTLRDMAFDCVGGIFPELIYNGAIHQEGMLILEMSHEANYKFIEHMSEPIDDSLTQILANKKTIVTIADALSPDLNGFLKNLSSLANSNTTILGAGAGGAELKQKASIFTPKGIYQNAAIVFYSHESVQLGQSHGWQKLSDPYNIQKVYGKTLVEIGENRKAFNVYRDLLQEKKGIVLDESNFSDIIKQFPLGIEKKDKITIRNIVKRNSNGLCTITDLPIEGNVYIMYRDRDLAQESIQEAVVEATENIEIKDRRFVFIFEGLERRESEQLVENDLEFVQKELGKVPQCGVVSIMEFSKYGSNDIEIFNNSILLGVVN